jgi:kynurenine formamidase
LVFEGYADMRRWVNRPVGSNWGDFGDDDQVGRLNLLTPARRLAAVHEAKTGIAFALSLPLDVPGGVGLTDSRKPPRRGHEISGGDGIYNLELTQFVATATDVCCDDSVLLYTQYSTQWDSLAHIGALFDADGDGHAEPVYYNGYRARIDVNPTAGAKALGIENQAAFPLQAAGVLIDLHAIYGERHVRVGYDALMLAIEGQDAVIKAGDVLCLHTGYSQALLDMNKSIDRERLVNGFATLDGRDERLLQWITDSEIVAIAADNMAVEHDYFHDSLSGLGGSGDAKSRPVFPLHHHCLFKLGMMFGELWYLTELAAWLRSHRRSRFLLTAAPLRLPGAVGSPVTPIATV